MDVQGSTPVETVRPDLVWRTEQEQGNIITFSSVQVRIAVRDGCILCGSHVVVPPDSEGTVMELVHEVHPGNNRIKGLARSVG